MEKISEYTEISAFNETTVLVRRGSSIYIKKQIPKDMLYIYKFLLENKHKNICGIVRIFEYEDSAAVIEEYIKGETISELLSKKGTQDEETVKNIIGQLCDGLIFLHKHNIVHRDINPNNVMITADKTVKIIDFDISRKVRKNSPADTEILGTAGFAAPEQFGFKQSDGRADIYAAGVLANVMLTGKMPNECPFNGRLGRVISRATEINAKDRYRSIEVFKYAFTNEIGENTNRFVKVLRSIPGFRTMRLWKMIIAIVVYATYIPLMAAFILWSADSKGIIGTIIGEIFMFVVPFMLLTNISDVRKFPAQKRVWISSAVFAVSLVSFLLGVLIILPNIK